MSDTLTGTINGCDSIIQLALTINTVDTSVVQVGAVLAANDSFRCGIPVDRLLAICSLLPAIINQVTCCTKRKLCSDRY